MESQLGTTNLFLGIMAAVSVLQALVLIGAGIAGFIAYKRVMTLVNSMEAQHVAPTVIRVNSILDDVKVVSAKVRAETERVDHAINSTIDRVDDTVDRMRWNVRAKTSRLIGMVRGARLAIETILNRAA
jgi:pyrimidine operon attenuation protein/uracil phosphoribosyltransferase